jgi:hypothetical protein
MGCDFAAVPGSPKPFKFQEARRYHILEAWHRVQNRPDDDRSFVRRGDIRVWLSEDAIAVWRAACRTTPGGQGRFSNLVIETALILGAALRLPLRQTEGFMRSLIEVMKLDADTRSADIRRSPWPVHNRFAAALRVNRKRTLISRRNFAPRTFGSRTDVPPQWPHGAGSARPEQGRVGANSGTIPVCLTAPSASSGPQASRSR